MIGRLPQVNGEWSESGFSMKQFHFQFSICLSVTRADMASVHFWRVRLGGSEILARQISQSYSFLWHGRILSRMCCRCVLNRRLFSHGWHGFRFPRKLLKRLKFYTSWYQSFASGLKVKENDRRETNLRVHWDFSLPLKLYVLPRLNAGLLYIRFARFHTESFKETKKKEMSKRRIH